jgi:hypothetical protein
MILKYDAYKSRNVKNINESESKQNDEILIAINEAYWGWDDSSMRNTANLFLNIKTGDLRLFITNRNMGSGLGAGRDITKTLFDGNVGNIEKPNLKLIISTLAKKENRMTVTKTSGYNYSRLWHDVQNNVKDTLSNILANNRGVKTTKLLRSIEEPKSATPKTTNGSKREKLATLHSKLWKLSDSDIDALLQKLSEGKTNESNDNIESSLKKGDKFEYVFLYEKGKKEENIKIVVDDPENYMDEEDCETEAIKQFKAKHGDIEFEVIDK